MDTSYSRLRQRVIYSEKGEDETAGKSTLLHLAGEGK
jgi:hypothetical protein